MADFRQKDQSHRYIFKEASEPVFRQLPAKTINLFPVTNCWVKDFPKSYNNPICHAYFQHSKYEQYPVVGVTYFQARAYCEWVTAKLNVKYQIPGHRLVASLPNQIERTLARTYKDFHFSDVQSSHRSVFVYGPQEHNFFTSLRVNYTEAGYDLLSKNMSTGASTINGIAFFDDGYLFTAPSKGDRKVKTMVPADVSNEVQNLNTNVSEWMSETYQHNWKDLYDFRQRSLRSLRLEDARILADLEQFYNGYNNKMGALVRGGNWFNEQNIFQNGQNVGTLDAKVFLHPAAAHSTVGFRYVVRFVPIETNPDEN
ncbi:MAG: hypothetical protein ACI8ZN_001492 [Bacteroidia bacterium]|jgi:hypothetical protein